MANYYNNAVKVLKKNKKRLTRPRKLVVSILDKTTEPLSPYKIRDELNRYGFKVDVVTIYRILDQLCQLHLAHYIASAKGFMRCDVQSANGCHFFNSCVKCGHVEEVVPNRPGEVTKVLNSQFTEAFDSAYVEMRYVCPNCR